jgi:hypothetical protein
MSIKIRNGFRIPMMPIKKLHERLAALRAVCLDHAEREIARIAYRHMAALADHRLLGLPTSGEDPTASPFSSVAMNFLKRAGDVKHAGARRDPEIDFGFEICLIPLKGYYLGMHFGEQKFFIDKFYEMLPGAHEYHYQNSTDKPDGISDRHWRKRRNDWDAALPGYAAPIDAGFMCNLCNPKEFVTLADLSPDLCPSFEDRLQMAARSIAFDRKWVQEGKPSNARLSEVMSIDRWLHREPEGVAFVEAVKVEIAPKLPPAYTPADLCLKPQGATPEG